MFTLVSLLFPFVVGLDFFVLVAIYFGLKKNKKKIYELSGYLFLLPFCLVLTILVFSL